MDSGNSDKEIFKTNMEENELRPNTSGNVLLGIFKIVFFFLMVASFFFMYVYGYNKALKDNAKKIDTPSAVNSLKTTLKNTFNNEHDLSTVTLVKYIWSNDPKKPINIVGDGLNDQYCFFLFIKEPFLVYEMENLDYMLPKLILKSADNQTINLMPVGNFQNIGHGQGFAISIKNSDKTKFKKNISYKLEFVPNDRKPSKWIIPKNFTIIQN